MQTRNKYFLALWENRTACLQNMLFVYVFLVGILIPQNAINQSPNANSVAFKKNFYWKTKCDLAKYWLNCLM